MAKYMVVLNDSRFEIHGEDCPDVARKRDGQVRWTKRGPVVAKSTNDWPQEAKNAKDALSITLASDFDDERSMKQAGFSGKVMNCCK